MAKEKAVTATIVSKERRREIKVGVNGSIKTFPLNKAITLEPWEREAIENSGYQLVVSDGKATASAEGSALAVDQGPDDNRTEPHQGPEEGGDIVPAPIPGVENADGAPVLKGGDEPDPLHGEGASGAQSGDDTATDPPIKTTAAPAAKKPSAAKKAAPAAPAKDAAE